jgi:hypothetical protein
MSPTRAASGLDLENRAVRSPEGSRSVIWEAWIEAMGSLKWEAGEGGGGKVLILRFTARVVSWLVWMGGLGMRM